MNQYDKLRAQIWETRQMSIINSFISIVDILESLENRLDQIPMIVEREVEEEVEEAKSEVKVELQKGFSNMLGEGE